MEKYINNIHKPKLKDVNLTRGNGPEKDKRKEMNNLKKYMRTNTELKVRHNY